MNNQKKILIIKGPAGLTAGFILTQNGYKVEINEENEKICRWYFKNRGI